MTIRLTTYADIEALLAIFAHARTQMIADGNPTQWGDGYPSCEQLESDVQRGVSYVVEHNGQPCATFVFIIGEDPTYAYIEDGEWRTTPCFMAPSIALPLMENNEASSHSYSIGAQHNAAISASTRTKIMHA